MTIDVIFDIILTSKSKEKKMSDTRFIFLMITLFTVLFTLILIIVHGFLDMNNKNVDKISEISNKADVSCEVKTNQFLYLTVHKIVK